MKLADIPLFPLKTVLFPNGKLKLRIFEQKYIDMVRVCSARGSGFGICLISPATQKDRHVTHMRTGTLVDISDWSTLKDGLLGITVTGRQKFVTRHTRMRDNGLLMGQVIVIPEINGVAVPEQYSVLSIIVGRFMEVLNKNYPDFRPPFLEDASWVSYRLAELLPLENWEKQALLQINEPLDRLQFLLEVIPRFQDSSRPISTA